VVGNRHRAKRKSESNLLRKRLSIPFRSDPTTSSSKPVSAPHDLATEQKSFFGVSCRCSLSVTQYMPRQPRRTMPASSAALAANTDLIAPRITTGRTVGGPVP
jgi:hypothetical protein